MNAVRAVRRPERVADVDAGRALRRGRDRGDRPGSKRGADEERASDHLSHAGSIGELVGNAGIRDRGGEHRDRRQGRALGRRVGRRRAPRSERRAQRPRRARRRAGPASRPKAASSESRVSATKRPPLSRRRSRARASAREATHCAARARASMRLSSASRAETVTTGTTETVTVQPSAVFRALAGPRASTLRRRVARRCSIRPARSAALAPSSAGPTWKTARPSSRTGGAPSRAAGRDRRAPRLARRSRKWRDMSFAKSRGREK